MLYTLHVCNIICQIYSHFFKKKMLFPKLTSSCCPVLPTLQAQALCRVSSCSNLDSDAHQACVQASQRRQRRSATYLANSRVSHEAGLPGSKSHTLSPSRSSSSPVRETSWGLSAIANSARGEVPLKEPHRDPAQQKSDIRNAYVPRCPALPTAAIITVLLTRVEDWTHRGQRRGQHTRSQYLSSSPTYT